MKPMVYIITILAFCFLSHSMALTIVEMDTESLIKASIGNLKDPNRDPSKYFEISDEEFKNANPQKLLALLATYNSDKSYSVRNLALLYTVRIANIHPTEEIRKEVTYRLVRDLIEPNSNTHHKSSGWLLNFTKDDFNENSKEMLHKALAENMPDSSVIKICGVADMKEELPRLKELITIDEIKYNNEDPFLIEISPWYQYQSRGWAARQARARMGVKEDITLCIDLAESVADVNDRVVWVLPGIGYARRPEAIEYLKKYLESDGRLPFPGQSHASRVMHILAVSLSNFPIEQKRSRGYTEEEIALCRKWMLEQKEWQIIR